MPSGLAAAADAGWLTRAEADALTETYDVFWALHAATRLVSGERPVSDTPGEGAARFLCRSAGIEDIETLKSRLGARYAQTAAVIEAALQRGGSDTGT